MIPLRVWSDRVPCGRSTSPSAISALVPLVLLPGRTSAGRVSSVTDGGASPSPASLSEVPTTNHLDHLHSHHERVESLLPTDPGLVMDSISCIGEKASNRLSVVGRHGMLKQHTEPPERLARPRHESGRFTSHYCLPASSGTSSYSPRTPTGEVC